MDKQNHSLQYNGLADAYHRFSLENKEIIYVSDPLLMSLIGDADGKKILDIGCGSGSHLSVLAERDCKSLVGIDISEKLIDTARSRLPEAVSLLVASASEKDFVERVRSTGIERFDLIYHSFVQVHNANLEQMKTFWRNIHGLLEEGGKAIGITSDPNAASPAGADKLMGLLYEFPGGAPLQDGDIFRAHLSPELTVTSHYWTFATVEKIMKEVGFRAVARALPRANEISMQGFSREEWEIIEQSGAIYALVGEK